MWLKAGGRAQWRAAPFTALCVFFSHRLPPAPPIRAGGGSGALRRFPGPRPVGFFAQTSVQAAAEEKQNVQNSGQPEGARHRFGGRVRFLVSVLVKVSFWLTNDS